MPLYLDLHLVVVSKVSFSNDCKRSGKEKETKSGARTGRVFVDLAPCLLPLCPCQAPTPEATVDLCTRPAILRQE